MDSDAGPDSYKDSKKYLWLLSPLYIALPILGIYLAEQTGWSLFYWLPLIMFHFFFPIIDHLVGVDRDNPPEIYAQRHQNDIYYKMLPLIAVPIHMVTMLLIMVYWDQTKPDGFISLALALSVGWANGLAINTGHELGHKKSSLERWFAKIALSLSGYGHFYVEHNKGHHYHVATPEDCASARYNESLYAFIMREWFGGVARCWQLEASRLKKRGLPVFSLKNEMVQTTLMTGLFYGMLIAFFGLKAIPFLLIQMMYAWFLLSLANYTEHYGLLRQKKANGKYENCQPHHSWNSNYLMSNLVLFHLQRHSDHHSNPARRYQILRDFQDVPTLPSGYPLVFTMAIIPPLFKRVMNPRVLKWVDGDMSKVNQG